MKSRSQLKSNSNLSGLVNGQLGASEFLALFLEKVGPVLAKYKRPSRDDDSDSDDDDEEEIDSPPPKKPKIDYDVVSIESDMSLLENSTLDFGDFRESDVKKEIASLSKEIHEVKEIVENTQQSVKALAVLLKTLVKKICNNK